MSDAYTIRPYPYQMVTFTEIPAVIPDPEPEPPRLQRARLRSGGVPNLERMHLTALEPNEHRVQVAWCLETIRIRCEGKLASVDSIVCRGKSGMLVASVVSALTGIPLSVCNYPRGDETSSHSKSRQVLGCAAPKRYIIIDDFVDSGRTIRELQDAIAESCTRWNKWGSTCEALLLYDALDDADRIYAKLEKAGAHAIDVFARYDGRASHTELADELHAWGWK